VKPLSENRLNDERGHCGVFSVSVGVVLQAETVFDGTCAAVFEVASVLLEYLSNELV
jgi:hypothetical protein